jgi:DNA-nicking Smr family endonuclease
VALSSFGCLVSGESHLFKVCVYIGEGLVTGNNVLSRIVFHWLEDGQKLLSLLDSTALLLW